jgi:hypothetical protein
MYKQMNNKGSALVLVVFAMLISFFLGIALLEVSTVEFAMANNHVDGVKADYIAEAGMNKAIASFMYNTELLQELPVLLENIGDTFTLEIGESFAGGSFSDAEIKLIDKAKEYIIIELTTFGTYRDLPIRGNKLLMLLRMRILKSCKMLLICIIMITKHGLVKICLN